MCDYRQNWKIIFVLVQTFFQLLSYVWPNKVKNAANHRVFSKARKGAKNFILFDFYHCQHQMKFTSRLQQSYERKWGNEIVPLMFSDHCAL